VTPNRVNFASVTIGSQVWMAANLNVDRFRNGDAIPAARTAEEWKRATDNQQPAWCYYENDPANGAIYGKLYNWYAVNDPRGLAPEGWHVATDGEWTMLSDGLGGPKVAGGKMKSASGWLNNGNGSDASRFSGRPGGSRNNDGAFYFKSIWGNWWSPTAITTNGIAWVRSLSDSSENLYRSYSSKGFGFSVRCLRD